MGKKEAVEIMDVLKDDQVSNDHQTKVEENKMEKQNWINENDVHYLRILSGSHKDEVVRYYGMRSKDKVLYGKSLTTNKTIVFGRSVIDPEFLVYKNIPVSDKSTKNKDYSSILSKFE